MHCKFNFLVTLLVVCCRAGRLQEPINILAYVHKKRLRLPFSPHRAKHALSCMFHQRWHSEGSLTRFVTQTALCASLTHITI
jgi:hypothetical protein